MVEEILDIFFSTKIFDEMWTLLNSFEFIKLLRVYLYIGFLLIIIKFFFLTLTDLSFAGIIANLFIYSNISNYKLKYYCDIERKCCLYKGIHVYNHGNIISYFSKKMNKKNLTVQ